MNPRPHSVDLTINSTLRLPVDIPVRIDPLKLSLGYVQSSSNSPFAQVHIPGTISWRYRYSRSPKPNYTTERPAMA